MINTTVASAPRLIGLLRPVLVGCGLAILFLIGLQLGFIPSDFLRRYVMGHPVSLIETGMLFVGLAFLLYKVLGLRKEEVAVANWNVDLKELWNRKRDQIITGGGTLPATLESPNGEASNEESLSLRERAESVAHGESTKEQSEDYRVAEYLVRKLQASDLTKNSSLFIRIRSALDFVKNRQSADGIDDQLKHLAVQDQDLQHENNSLVRLMIWAIPMLGFLGTVIGISEALGGLDLGGQANLSTMIGSLKSSLYVAFDTTALALCYGVILMFLQFATDRKETRLLQQIDEIADDQILNTFSATTIDRDPVARSVQKMGQALLKATFSLVEHQHELWNESLVSAQDAWISATENAKIQSDSHMKEILDAAGDGLALKLATALEDADKQLHHRWQQWQVSLSDNTRTLATYQENAASHLEMLKQFFQSASDLSGEQRERIDQLTDRLSSWMEVSLDDKKNQTQLHQRMVQKINETNDLLKEASHRSEQQEGVHRQQQTATFEKWTNIVQQGQKTQQETENKIAEGLGQIVESIRSFQPSTKVVDASSLVSGASEPADPNRLKSFDPEPAGSAAVGPSESLGWSQNQTPEVDDFPRDISVEPKVRSVPGKIGRIRRKVSPAESELSQEQIVENGLLGGEESIARTPALEDSEPAVVPFQRLLNPTGSENGAVSSDLSRQALFFQQDRQAPIVLAESEPSKDTTDLRSQDVTPTAALPLEAEGLDQIEEVEPVNSDVRSNLVPFRDARIHRTA